MVWIEQKGLGDSLLSIIIYYYYFLSLLLLFISYILKENMLDVSIKIYVSIMGYVEWKEGD